MLLNNKNFFANEEQKLLLSAALFCNELATDAYHQWRKKVDINLLPASDTKLLPLLYRNLRFLGIHDDLTEKLKGVVRYITLKNHRHLFFTLPLIKTLIDRNIPYVLLKGAALSLGYYGNLSVRPMEDVDLLISRDNLREVVDEMKSLGFRPQVEDVDVHNHFLCRHSLGFINDDGGRLDLHCYILEDCCRDGGSHPFLRSGREGYFQEVKISLPNATDHLFHTIVHGMRWNESSQIRWIADACTIIESAEIDWEQLCSYVERYQLIVPMREGLIYLNEIFYQEIPETVIKRLTSLKPSSIDEREFRFHASSYNSVLSSYRHHRDLYSKNGHQSFLQFCQQYWGVESLSKLPSSMVKKVIKKLRSSSL